MIVLDTNVLSELTRNEPAKQVVTWLDRQDTDEVYVTAITKAEIKFGLEMMPEGKRRLELNSIYDRLFTTMLLGKVLPFDDASTDDFARLAASCRKRGLAPSSADLQIAAIASYHSAAVATRNILDFDHEGLQVINPWMG